MNVHFVLPADSGMSAAAQLPGGRDGLRPGPVHRVSTPTGPTSPGPLGRSPRRRTRSQAPPAYDARNHEVAAPGAWRSRPRTNGWPA